MSDEAQKAFGGDPLNPNDELIKRIAAALSGGEPDDSVTRWAAAFKAVCPDPVDNSPRVSIEDWNASPVGVRVHLGSPFLARAKLAKVAEAVGGSANDEASEWAKSVKEGVK